MGERRCGWKNGREQSGPLGTDGPYLGNCRGSVGAFYVGKYNRFGLEQREGHKLRIWDPVEQVPTGFGRSFLYCAG